MGAAPSSSRGARRGQQCIFCPGGVGAEPRSKRLHTDDPCYVVRDIAPACQTHLLIVPVRHVRDIDALEGEEDARLVEHMERVGRRLLEEHAAAHEHMVGFHRPPFNSVSHLHLHCFALPFTPFLKRLKYLPGISFKSPQWVAQRARERESHSIQTKP